MKILVNTRFLLPNALEGIGLYTYEVLSRLVKCRPDDEFIFCFDRPFSDQFVFAGNVTPIVLPPPARHAVLFWWWYHRAIPKAYKRHNADLFFSPDAFTALSHKVSKTLLTVHDLAYLHYPDQISRSNLWYYQTYMPMYLKRADRIIAVSESTKQDIITQFPHLASKVETIYNGARLIFSPLSRAEQDKIRQSYTNGKPFFISIGALHPRKNIARLIKAFTQFKSSSGSDVKLLIIGRKAWKTNHIREAKVASRVAADIIFLDYIQDDLLTKLLASSRALIYISLFEGFGLPIVDAMRSGVPVITSNRSSMKEIGGSAVKLVDPENIENIALAMHAIETDLSLVKKLISQGFERAQDFSWDQSVASHSALIDDLL